MPQDQTDQIPLTPTLAHGMLQDRAGAIFNLLEAMKAVAKISPGGCSKPIEHAAFEHFTNVLDQQIDDVFDLLAAVRPSA